MRWLACFCATLLITRFIRITESLPDGQTDNLGAEGIGGCAGSNRFRPTDQSRGGFSKFHARTAGKLAGGDAGAGLAMAIGVEITSKES